ncbi:MAG TPA: DMT family transporter [Trebonia sp.]|nr:DMT family transporter [Trebonia sp.]
MSRRGTVLFVVMGIIWGIPYLLIKVADGAVAVPVLVWSRVVIGALILVPVALAQGAWRPSQRALLRRSWHWLAAYALIEIIVPWALLSSAERRLPSSASGLLIASVPAIGALLAWMTRSGDRLTAVRAAGLALGLAGVVLLAGPGAVHGDLAADAEVMGTAVCYAAGPLIANRHLTEVPSIAANAACLSLAAAVYTVPAVLSWPHAMPSASVLASLVALGAVCTAGGLVLYFWLIAEIGAARATVVTYVNPAVAVALGALVLGEPFTAQVAGSFVLILAGSVLATRRARLPESSPARLSRSPQRG